MTISYQIHSTVSFVSQSSIRGCAVQTLTSRKINHKKETSEGPRSRNNLSGLCSGSSTTCLACVPVPQQLVWLVFRFLNNLSGLCSSPATTSLACVPVPQQLVWLVFNLQFVFHSVHTLCLLRNSRIFLRPLETKYYIIAGNRSHPFQQSLENGTT
jgi:hypothetical protein